MKNFCRILNFFLLLTFLLSLLTGIVKFPELQRHFLFVYDYISPPHLTALHDWSGLAFIILIIVHLVLNRRPLAAVFVIRKPQRQPAKIIVPVIIMAALLLGWILIYFRPFGTGKIVSLGVVEVTQYQGEKLGSINDFRENSIKGPQYVSTSTYSLEVSGLVDQPLKYNYDDILKFIDYQKVVQINCVEGWSVSILWDGVLVKDLIKAAGVQPAAKSVIFYAVDGYSTSFPLSYIMNNNIMMADKMNGVVLPPERGFPFQLVAEQKWGYKWIKWINKIELSDDVNYKGFWESRGYSNSGDLNNSFLLPDSALQVRK